MHYISIENIIFHRNHAQSCPSTHHTNIISKCVFKIIVILLIICLYYKHQILFRHWTPQHFLVQRRILLHCSQQSSLIMTQDEKSSASRINEHTSQQRMRAWAVVERTNTLGCGTHYRTWHPGHCTLHMTNTKTPTKLKHSETMYVTYQQCITFGWNQTNVEI